MSHTVLITGGSGLIGTHLSRLLQANGYQVRHLSRRRAINAEFPTYSWQIEQNTIDHDAIDKSVETIIHLAGAGIGDKRWTPKRKADIVHSRTASTQLLIKYLQNQPNCVQTFIGGSAIGYYGNSGNNIVSETDLPSDHSFLSSTTQQWENAYQPLLANTNLRSVILRIGIVLAKNGGALPKMAIASRWGIAAYFGNGKQYMSWICIDDLCRLFLYAIKNQHIQGTYNAVATQVLNNKTFMQLLAQYLSKNSTWAVPVPSWLLRATMGEMADVVLHGCHASNAKIIATGFQFQSPNFLADIPCLNT